MWVLNFINKIILKWDSDGSSRTILLKFARRLTRYSRCRFQQLPGEGRWVRGRGRFFSGRVQRSRRIEQKSVSRCGNACKVFRENSGKAQSVRARTLGILISVQRDEKEVKEKLLFGVRTWKASKLST